MESPVPVRVKGVYIAESEGSNPAPVVLLEDEGGRIVPIFVGLSEAISIHHALCGELAPRPMTHDLFICVLESLSASITNVLIDDLDGGIYYARLTIKSDSRQSEIDARPSDCLALALRAKAPIEVQEMVMAEASISKSDAERLTSIDNYLQ
ncbi:MAG TPA: bifunctional nuclease family protein [Methanothrix sp.]|uniref:bifunctional nuclease family protein n=1 Tax=Methanothrix sp. TaxID=90426 RepID=UPI002C354A69|nr:bifunctional nuclease family protein [Methanothrix sp.]HON35591.1 bifunctional nuclease family protein [Methanothrix sp.]